MSGDVASDASIIVTVLVSLSNLGRVATVAAFIYTFCANAFFLLRSLKYVLLPDSSTSATTFSPSQRNSRIRFLFVVAAAQALWMGMLIWV